VDVGEGEDREAVTNQKDEDKLDETLEETFPASDPPANTVETGVRLGTPSDVPVSDNAARSRFELTVDGHTGYLTYERAQGTLTLVHTEVPEEIRGRHLGDRLVEAALDAGRSQGLRIVVVCPFARTYLRRHRSPG
jgi:predicted GNAT family acetyltransferase